MAIVKNMSPKKVFSFKKKKSYLSYKEKCEIGNSYIIED